MQNFELSVGNLDTRTLQSFCKRSLFAASSGPVECKNRIAADKFQIEVLEGIAGGTDGTACFFLSWQSFQRHLKA